MLTLSWPFKKVSIFWVSLLVLQQLVFSPYLRKNGSSERLNNLPVVEQLEKDQYRNLKAI